MNLLGFLQIVEINFEFSLMVRVGKFIFQKKCQS